MGLKFRHTRGNGGGGSPREPEYETLPFRLVTASLRERTFKRVRRSDSIVSVKYNFPQ